MQGDAGMSARWVQAAATAFMDLGHSLRGELDWPDWPDKLDQVDKPDKLDKNNEWHHFSCRRCPS